MIPSGYKRFMEGEKGKPGHKKDLTEEDIEDHEHVLDQLTSLVEILEGRPSNL